MRKDGGVLIIEVKDWNLDSYYTDASKSWYVKYNNSKIKSPINQVLKYKENIYDLHINDLLHLKLKDYKYWFIVNCAIFFYKENDFDVTDFLLEPFEIRKSEINSFDKYYGHPSPTSQYHYHVEPLYLTTVKVTKSSLLGFLLDGFPVYGPEENGALIDNSKLDAYHGHTSVTSDFPSGIYQYHITNTDPYINGSGYYGTPGTVSQ